MKSRLICTAAALLAVALAGCSSSSSGARTNTFAKIQTTAQVTVPSVQGAALTDATAQLKQAQLRWRVQRRYAEQGVGSVIDVSPGAGTKVARGTEVVLVLSRGPQPQPAAAPAAPAPPPSSPSPAPKPPSNGGTPSVNSQRGQHALHNSPDCQHAPPPPPGYTGPVQC
jgi:beta-lactam-binding protein with PASTA domain